MKWTLIGLYSFCCVLCYGQKHVQKTKTVDFKKFTIAVPVEWEWIKVKGEDSYVGEIQIDNKTKLNFDMGYYSNPLDDDEDLTKNYYIKIDGYEAKLVKPKRSGIGTTGVYIQHIKVSDKGTNSFQLSGQNLTNQQERQVIKAIKTLKFIRKLTPILLDSIKN